MRNEDLLSRINEWARKTPENEARAALALRGVYGAIADELVKGKYKRTPQGPTKFAFEDILKNEKAS